MMARIAVVLLNHDSMRLTDDMAFGWQHVSEGFPVIGVKDAVCQVFDLVVEPPEGCSITTPDNPGNSSP
jgi:hypothetical protein